MSVLYFSGAELGSKAAAASESGIDQSATSGLSFVTSPVRSGNYAARLDLAFGDGANRVWYSAISLNKSTLYAGIGLYFHMTSLPGGATVVDFQPLSITDNAGAAIAYTDLAVNSSGQCTLALVNSITSSVIGSVFTVQQDTWYYVSLKVVVSATVGQLEMIVDGVSVASGTNLNTGTNNCDRQQSVASSGQALNGAAGYMVLDDMILDDARHPHKTSKVILRQGTAGSPTNDAFTKTGAATSALCWSDTPFATGTNCNSNSNGAAQTMLVATFASTQTGHGSETLGATENILACKTSMIAKVASASSHSIRRRINGTNTDTAKSLATSDGYFDDGIWIDARPLLNSAEIGVLHGADTNLVTVEDMYLQVAYDSKPRFILGGH